MPKICERLEHFEFKSYNGNYFELSSYQINPSN